MQMKQVHALVVDDNVKNLGVLSRLLARQGVVCTEASSANQLAGVLKTLTEVDVVFLDLEMPGVNGYEIMRQLKTDARFESVPFVAYTVHLSEINTAHQRGFHSFLGKPVDAEKFPEQLDHILNGEPVWSNGM
jgi:CheY-like chemotaxis protein